VSAQSALLKTLEEPQDKVVIILLAEDEHSLPATILSRCQIIYFYPVPEYIIYDYLISDYKLNRSFAKNLASLALGRPLLAVNFLNHPEGYKDYLQKAETWLELLTQDTDDRLISLDKIFKDKTFSSLAVNSAKEVLFMAEGLSRDLLLLSMGRKDTIQHSALILNLTKTLEFLNKQNNGDSTVLFLNHFKLISKGREYLDSNINPHLILERIVINF
jgi:DNA polymerase-3 subunit delta'